MPATDPPDQDLSSLNQAPPEGAPRAEDAPVIRVLMINRDAADGIAVGTRPVPQRWHGTFLNLPIDRRFEIDEVSPTQLATALKDTSDPVIVVDGTAVMDPSATEIAAAIEPETDAVTVFTGPPSGLAPLVWVGAGVASRLAEVGYQRGESVHAWRQRAEVSTVEHALDRGYWLTVTSKATAKRAEWGLLRQLQHRPGGLVARYLNRPISLRMTRLLVNTPVTPNMTTWFAFLLGAVAVPLFIVGGYWEAVIAAVLLQLNSIIDGVDGELARIRQRQSIFGAYLDSVTDEILTAAYLVSLGFHLHANGAPDYYIPLGVLGGGAFFIYACAHWHCKWKHGLGFYWWWDAYKPRKQVQRDTSAYAYLKKLFVKESLQFIIIFAAVFEFLEVFSWAFGVAGAGILLLLFIHIVILRARW